MCLSFLPISFLIPLTILNSFMVIWELQQFGFVYGGISAEASRCKGSSLLQA